MKYKEFYKWCSDRCFDGCWGMNEAMICVSTVEVIQKVRFWEREKVWQEKYAENVVPIVEATNERIEQVKRSEILNQ